MHEMLTIVTDVRSVCLSVCHTAVRAVSVCLSVTRQCVQYLSCVVCAGSFGSAFTKCLWPLVFILKLEASVIYIIISE